jgi:hypothetical protein
MAGWLESLPWWGIQLYAFGFQAVGFSLEYVRCTRRVRRSSSSRKVSVS